MFRVTAEAVAISGMSCTRTLCHSFSSLIPHLADSSQIISGAASSSSSDEDRQLAYVIAPVVGGVVVIMLIGIIFFLSLAKKERSMHGKYNPQKQEFIGLRYELNEMKMKPPPVERLI